MVTPTVEGILIRLRDPRNEPLLWLDLLCIDQSNKDEKDRQVLRMKDIWGSTVCNCLPRSAYCLEAVSWRIGAVAKDVA